MHFVDYLILENWKNRYPHVLDLYSGNCRGQQSSGISNRLRSLQQRNGRGGLCCIFELWRRNEIDIFFSDRFVVQKLHTWLQRSLRNITKWLGPSVLISSSTLPRWAEKSSVLHFWRNLNPRSMKATIQLWKEMRASTFSMRTGLRLCSAASWSLLTSSPTSWRSSESSHLLRRLSWASTSLCCSCWCGCTSDTVDSWEKLGSLSTTSVKLCGNRYRYKDADFFLSQTYLTFLVWSVHFATFVLLTFSSLLFTVLAAGICQTFGEGHTASCQDEYQHRQWRQENKLSRCLI